VDLIILAVVLGEILSELGLGQGGEILIDSRLNLLRRFACHPILARILDCGCFVHDLVEKQEQSSNIIRRRNCRRTILGRSEETITQEDAGAVNVDETAVVSGSEVLNKRLQGSSVSGRHLLEVHVIYQQRLKRGAYSGERAKRSLIKSVCYSWKTIPSGTDNSM
jgi:hypothetical protein